MPVRRTLLALIPAALAAPALPQPARAALPAAEEIADIAEAAMVYGLPMVMNYGVVFEYFIDRANPAFKAGFNTLYNTARVYTPADTTIVTPNSDTPYSFVQMDLRAEPFVFCAPAIEAGRYWSLQVIDWYTFNVGYAGSRTTGNAAGCVMVVGPRWQGETPPGIARVIRSGTDFATGLIRTQLFRPDDIEAVRRIQAGYRAQPLSAFLNRPAPPAPPAIVWPRITAEMAERDPFGILAFVLQFAPPIGDAAMEAPLRERFARIGIAAGQPFQADSLTPAQRAALAEGARRGMARIAAARGGLGVVENGWQVATRAFGDRAMIAGDWARRAAAAQAGIYGNDAAEALYPMLLADDAGERPDTGRHRYALTFPPGALPPANAFWSVTMYDGKTQLLVANPLDRYLINTPMLDGMRRDADGGLTLHLQKDSPGAEREPNWLPAPDGPAFIVMRLYWPRDEALTGAWKPPALRRLP
jgi:hypothetical protein